MRNENRTDSNIVSNTAEMIIKANPATGVLHSPMACDFCNRGVPTTHVCRFPGGNRRINEDGEKYVD